MRSMPSALSFAHLRTSHKPSCSCTVADPNCIDKAAPCCRQWCTICRRSGTSIGSPTRPPACTSTHPPAAPAVLHVIIRQLRGVVPSFSTAAPRKLPTCHADPAVTLPRRRRLDASELPRGASNCQHWARSPWGAGCWSPAPVPHLSRALSGSCLATTRPTVSEQR